MFGAFRAVRQAKRHGLTLLHVWLTPTSMEALKAIQAHEQLSGHRRGEPGVAALRSGDRPVRPQRQIEPVVMTDLSAVHLKAAVELQDGIPVLYIHDGVSAVVISGERGSGLANSFGIERLITAAHMYADMLRRRQP